MTTIAWDGRELAADACSWSGGVRRRVRKVQLITASTGARFLVAFAGNGSFAEAVLGWMRGQLDRPDPLAFMGVDQLDRACAVVIDERRRIWQLGNDLVYSRMRERRFAFGAGQEFAWGALEAGSTARQAIQIAMKRSDYAGLGVDVVRF